jgi:hypothetical protein
MYNVIHSSTCSFSGCMFIVLVLQCVCGLGVNLNMSDVVLQIRYLLLKKVVSNQRVESLVHTVRDHSMCCSSEGPSCALVNSSTLHSEPLYLLDGILFPAERISDWNTLSSRPKNRL